MVEVELIRHSNQIDPHLTIWGWEIPVYLFLGGLAAGVMILAALLRLRSQGGDLSRWARWLPFAAPIALSIGMLALFIDLANREHVWRFYTTLRLTSPMSWGAWILVAIYPLTVLLGMAGLRDKEIIGLVTWGPVQKLGLGKLIVGLVSLGRRYDRSVTWLNVVFGIGLGTYTGLLLGTLAARPAWNSVVLGPLFLVSGLSTGAALMILFPMRESEHHALRRWDMLAIGLELGLIALFLLSLVASAGEPGLRAVSLFFGGRFTAAFWTLVILAGLIVPLLLEALESRRNLRPSPITPALVLVGGLSLRWIVVLAGQA